MTNKNRFFVLLLACMTVGFAWAQDNLKAALTETLDAATADAPVDATFLIITLTALYREGSGVEEVENGEWRARPEGTLDPSRMDNVYDLSGRKINSSLITRHSSFPKGIYIAGGKKVLVK